MSARVVLLRRREERQDTSDALIVEAGTGSASCSVSLGGTNPDRFVGNGVFKHALVVIGEFHLSLNNLNVGRPTGSGSATVC